ncbi:MAG: hypothetical protein ACK4MH_06540 [Brevundimonas sp.]|uniref:hypothetical protein n=1 Tax=Brevundimonas sp. TaxID=1871086 RepID=UPI00391A29CE
MAKGLTRDGPGCVWIARKAVPATVRDIVNALPADDPRRAVFIGPTGRARAELWESTGHVDLGEAQAQGRNIHERWNRAIAGLRKRGNPQNVAHALDLIEGWRSNKVAWALGFGAMIDLFGAEGGKVEMSLDGARLEVKHLDLSAPSSSETPGLTTGAVNWAAAYFAAAPELDRGLTIPPATHHLIRLLREAETAPERWRDIDGFDARLQEVVGPLDAKVRTVVRPTFAKAWREVADAEEAERRFAATLLLVTANADAPVVAAAPAFAPTFADKTLSELLDAYEADFVATHNATKDLVAPLRALKEFFGEGRFVRSIENEDARAFAAFCEKIPANAGKLYKDTPLADAIERAQADGKPPVSRNTARRYITFASMIWNWAGKNDFADRNPFRGRAGPRKASVRREGFTDAELAAFFAALQPYKADGKALFFVPALGLNGARISELLQLRVGDVKEFEGTPYLDLSPFDETGRRDDDKSHKNAGSERLAPIHPLAIEAGIMDLVARRKAEGATRLFPEIKPRIQKGGKVDWAHYYSKRINKILDDAVTDAPRLVGGHGFRHTLRERYRKHDILEEVLDAIGGWSQQTVGRRYGRNEVKMLADNLAKINFGQLKI